MAVCAEMVSFLDDLAKAWAMHHGDIDAERATWYELVKVTAAFIQANTTESCRHHYHRVVL